MFEGRARYTDSDWFSTFRSLPRQHAGTMDDTEVTKSDTPTWIKSRQGSSEKFREILLNLELNEIFIPKIPWLAVGRTGKIFYNGKCLKRIGDGQQEPVHGSVVSIERGYPRGKTRYARQSHPSLPQWQKKDAVGKDYENHPARVGGLLHSPYSPDLATMDYHFLWLLAN